jgi:hypothetical protein
MLQPKVCVDHHLTISIKRGTARLSLDEALSVAGEDIHTSTRRINLEEASVITRQEIPDRGDGPPEILGVPGVPIDVQPDADAYGHSGIVFHQAFFVR